MQEDGSAIIGICPSSVVYSKSQETGVDYIGKLAEVIEILLLKGNTSVLLFPNATRDKQMDKFRNNDLPLIDQIYKRLIAGNASFSTKILAVDRNINTDSIKNMINFCDITIVSRFHAMIASLSMAIPVMVLGWSHKYFEVMKQFNMEAFVVDYQDEQHDFISSIERMLKEKDQYVSQITTNLPVVKQESYKQFEYIFKEVLHK